MNFVHVSDTHLAASNFKLKEREQDFLDAFKQVIDYCLKERPEFVIHSGDLFDKGKPNNSILLFTIKQLKKLKKEGIPLYIIPGSHDVSVDGTFITILEKVGLLTNVAKTSNFIPEEDYIKMKGEETSNAIIYGLPGRRANIKEMYDRVRPVNSDKFKIFMFHHITSNIKETEYFSDIPISSLPKGMDYYAGGHWHEHEEFTYEGKPVIYPGSTEYHDIEIMERGRPRGFIHYVNGEVKFIKIKTRMIDVKKVNCNNLDPYETTTKCIKEFKSSNKGLIILKLKGTLKNGKRNEIDVNEIRKKALSKGYLYCNIKLSNVNNPGEKGVTTANKKVNEIENDYLKSKGYSSEEIRTAINLINILGKDYTPNELIKAIIKAEELI